MNLYDSYLTRNIKNIYKTRMIAPMIYLVVLTILFFLLPIKDLVFPKELSAKDSLETSYESHNSYIKLQTETLYFTGYTNTRFGQTTGYYYYTIRNHQCLLVLLTPATSEEGLPTIKNQTVHGKILTADSGYHQLLTNLSQDLKWTEEGIAKQVSPYLLSEPGVRGISTNILLFIYFFSGLYALILIVLCILYYFIPTLSPTCVQLGRFGKANELLAQAEEELANLPQLATEDMFITENFFIEVSNFGVAVVPIKEIIWIYKHSTLHKFLWYHFVISYTLHITGKKHFYIQCPENIKSDIDGIIDYLSEANHNILVGFNEENRLKVQDIQHRGVYFEKIIAFLKRRI